MSDIPGPGPDVAYHPQWCDWCGVHGSKAPLITVIHHRTLRRALKCVDDVDCLRRMSEKKRRERAA